MSRSMTRLADRGDDLPVTSFISRKIGAAPVWIIRFRMKAKTRLSFSERSFTMYK